jgi:hypothetical protein
VLPRGRTRSEGTCSRAIAISLSVGIRAERFGESFAEGDKLLHMLEGYAHAQAKRIAHFAAYMERLPGSVPDDEHWNSLMEISSWAKKHAPHREFLVDAIPSKHEKRAWTDVRRAALAIVDSVTGQRGTIEAEESEIRAHVLSTADEHWRCEPNEQFSAPFGDDGYVCMTRHDIRFSRDLGLSSCTHTKETEARFEELLRGKRQAR